MGPYDLLEYSEQETPNESQDSGLIRVTHPHHPLYNQVIKVLRRAGNPAYPEPCYLIELPDQTRAELPCSWATPAVPGECSLLYSTPAPELWAGVVEYLALAHLVQAILAPAMEEKVNERLCFDCTSKLARTEQSSATLGTVPGGMPGRADPGAGCSPAASTPASGSAGGNGCARSGQ